MLGCLLWVASPVAQEAIPDRDRYIADIELQNSQELLGLLQRANQLMLDGVAVQDGADEVIFVLHGPVINSLLRPNYLDNQELVNLAARLTALQVVKLEACRTWMGINGVDEQDLQPFVVPVDLAAGEIRRLRQQENYVDF